MAAQNRAIKIRIYPNKEQAEYLDNVFGCCRFVWNQMLGDMKQFHDETGMFFIPTPACYKKKYKFLKDVDSLALANVQLDLKAALKKFKKERRVGFPKFKSKKKSKRSFTTNNNLSNAIPSIYVDGKHLRIPKVKGLIKAKLHRPISDGWVLKSATISQTASGKYFAALLFSFDAEDCAIITPTVDTTIGLDYSSPSFYVDSNGNSPVAAHYYRKAQKRLARAQKSLAKKHAMSNNYQKQKIKVARLHEKVANQRKDFCHKQSTAIAKQYNAVCVEDINLRGMAGSLRLGKATNDNGFGMFRTMLQYKLAAQGKSIIVVDKFYPSSKTCHGCGVVNKDIALKDRRWVCPSCGRLIDRDVNAALNIRDEGLRKYNKVQLLVSA